MIRSSAVALGMFTLRLVAEKKFAEAEAPARECLAIREKNLPDDWLTAATRSTFGLILLEQKKYDQAEPVLLASYKGLIERRALLYAQGESRLIDTLKLLVQLYEATNRPDQAADWKKKLAEFEKAAAETRAGVSKP
jgi:hypothetical protein